METPASKDYFSYTFERPDPLDHFPQYIDDLSNVSKIASEDVDVHAYLKQHLSELKNGLTRLDGKSDAAKLQCYSSFLPPRLVAACREGSLVPFFGSGISIAAGIPTWGALLEALGIGHDYISDPHVENDPLTQAELIALELGTDALQQKLRDQMKLASTPTLAHYQLAALQLPVYITTNYDSLFEQAWKNMGFEDLITVTTDADVIAHGFDSPKTFPVEGKSVLIKMHGDNARDQEQLILTRSDYRSHYRSNTLFFKMVKGVMHSGYVLFLGFGHRDPEVSRLVEDVVYEYEKSREGQRPPTLYSVQFDMRQRTPDVFAARGIVALRPPTVIHTLNPNQLRSASLAVELGELMAATDDTAHNAMDLREMLSLCVTELSDSLRTAMGLLESKKQQIVAPLRDKNKEQLKSAMEELIAELSPLKLAGQGVYLTYSNGDIAAIAVPEGLQEAERNRLKNFGDRPYFRHAKSFRRPFVSNTIASTYNGHSTIFLCMPLGGPSRFNGLLFAAAQPGAWPLPLELRDRCFPDVEFVLVDSNGIVIVPPVQEMKTVDPAFQPAGELAAANQGFPYQRIQELSRRDKHILHIVQNVVPIGWDDDVHDVSPDLRLYSMVADVAGTRWKLALSRPVPSTLAKNA